MAKNKAGKRKPTVTSGEAKTSGGNGREVLIAATDKAIKHTWNYALRVTELLNATDAYKKSGLPRLPSAIVLRDRMLRVADSGDAYGAAMIGMALGSTLATGMNRMERLARGGQAIIKARKARNGRATKINHKREAVRAAALKLTHKGITAASKSLANEFGIGQSTSRVWIQDLFPPAKKRSTE